MHARACDLNLVKALQVRRNPSCPEVIILAQIQYLAHDRARGFPRRVMWFPWPVRQTRFTELVVALLPAVERCPGVTEVSTGLGYVSWLLLCMSKDLQPPGHDPCLFCFGHAALPPRGPEQRAECVTLLLRLHTVAGWIDSRL